MISTMTPQPFEYELDDGRMVLIRDVRPSDRERVRRAYLTAGESTIYQRFFSIRPALSEAELDHLTQVDQYHHVAWGAVDLSNDEQPGVGIARFVRDEDNSQKAEIALAVADGWQGAGLGRVLLAVLYLLAREKNVTTLWGVTLFENHTLANWFRNLGATVTDEADYHEVSLPVSDSPSQLSPTSSADNLRKLIERLQNEWRRSSD
jgi:GNAT superfamily N-acetyltransferase